VLERIKFGDYRANEGVRDEEDEIVKLIGHRDAGALRPEYWTVFG
jgi:hypothetical protein